MVNDGEDVVAVAPLDVVQVCARLRQMLFPPEAVAVVVVGQLVVQLLLLLLLPAHPLVGAVDRSCHHKFRVRGRSRDLLAPMDLDSWVSNCGITNTPSNRTHKSYSVKGFLIASI